VAAAVVLAEKSTMQSELSEAALQALTVELEDIRQHLSPAYDRHLSHYCRAILTPEEFQKIQSKIPSLDSLGKDADTVAKMGTARRRHLAMVCDMLLSRLLTVAKAGSPDVAGILKAITELRSSVVGSALLERPALDPTQQPVIQSIALSYRKCIASGDSSTARSMLSVLVSSGELTDAQVIAVCSDIRPYKVGDTVWVTASGNLRTKMLAVAIEVDYVFVQPLISSGSGSSSALRVSRERVRALDSIV
jgi:hypothetical protein